jgi:adenylyltransferase/sulfurtransferase
VTTWTVNDTDLPQHTPIVVHCKAGGRSAEVLAVLKDPGFADAGFADAGFADAVHVGGGIVAWVNEIEPDKPSY